MQDEIGFGAEESQLLDCRPPGFLWTSPLAGLRSHIFRARAQNWIIMIGESFANLLELGAAHGRALTDTGKPILHDQSHP